MTKPTVLVFGTDEIMHQKLTSRLPRHGFAVTRVQGRAELYKKFEQQKPDLVIIYSTRKKAEHQLDVVQNLRKRDRYVPIILSTRYSSEPRAIAALRGGVNDYFKVPLSTEELLSSAKKLIACADHRPSKHHHTAKALSGTASR